MVYSKSLQNRRMAPLENLNFAWNFRMFASKHRRLETFKLKASNEPVNDNDRFLVKTFKLKVFN